MRELEQIAMLEKWIADLNLAIFIYSFVNEERAKDLRVRRSLFQSAIKSLRDDIARRPVT